MTLTMIRQPGYLPNIGFFKKIQTSDIFVYLDDAQFGIRSWDNRNRIRTQKGSSWLTVPVTSPHGKKLNEVKISYDSNWQRKHKQAIISSYGKTPFFKEFWHDIESIIDKKFDKLCDLNLELIKYLNSVLSIKTHTRKASEFGITSTGSERLIDICKKIKADFYLSGIHGKEYIDEQIFNEAGIRVFYENFQHPVYNQIHGKFIENISIIDLIFNEGENSKEILRNSESFDLDILN